MDMDLRPEASPSVVEAVRRAALEIGVGVSPVAAAYVSPWRLAALADALDREPEPAPAVAGAAPGDDGMRAAARRLARPRTPSAGERD